MSKRKPKRPQRTEDRRSARAAVGLVHDRERLFQLEAGGTAERPIDVPSSSVIEVRARALPCPQCEGSLALEDQAAPTALLRRQLVRCVRCKVQRAIWFRVAPTLN